MGRSTDVSIKEPITDKRPEFIDGKEINLGPVVCEWCYFAKPDDDVYKCEALLDEKMALSFAAAGVNVKRREDGQHYVDVKRKAHMGAPEVWAADGATEVDGFKVGNGSKLVLKVWMKYVDYKGRDDSRPVLRNRQSLSGYVRGGVEQRTAATLVL